MLEHAAKHHERLKELFVDIADDMRFQYMFCYSYRNTFQLNDSTWSEVQYVSVHDNAVIGYFSYKIDRNTDTVENLQIVNFTYEVNTIFAKDLARFLRNIFEKYKYRKLKFTCSADNPILPSYKRLCVKFGGRIVGVHRSEDKLLDGEYHDTVLFEVLRSDYMERTLTGGGINVYG